ncbi:uncharacterized protein LOC129773944 [Toxorhynchites rutilus septentrionalis]|uniref:uncharacterized protein LOC129773944 n=1 Tax=Toxorhynchites rutilus septentrionalis TaxID=329112 RepID=UPI002478FE07|nr:uncharacterized protein LOC129773944 [Toxorhynchites rutilus septentrionalis]
MSLRNKRKSLMRQVTEDEVDARDCIMCTRPNTADQWMVQCDVCSKWIHFSCAGVDKGVENECFVCAKCTTPPPPPRSKSGKSSSSSTRAKRELELQRLAEEKAMREKGLQDKLDLEKQFIEKKYEILQAGIDEDDDDRSGRSNRSVRSARSTVQGWVDKQEELTMVAGIGNNEIPTGTTSSTGTLPKRTSAPNQDDGQVASSSAVDCFTNQIPAASLASNTHNGVVTSGAMVQQSIQLPVLPSYPALQISPVTSRQQDLLPVVSMVISPASASGTQEFYRPVHHQQLSGVQQRQHERSLQQLEWYPASSAALASSASIPITISSKTQQIGRFPPNVPLPMVNQPQSSTMNNFLPHDCIVGSSIVGTTTQCVKDLNTGRYPPVLSREVHSLNSAYIPSIQMYTSSQSTVDNVRNPVSTFTASVISPRSLSNQQGLSVSSYSYPITSPVVVDRLVQESPRLGIPQTSCVPSVGQYPPVFGLGARQSFAAPTIPGLGQQATSCATGIQQFGAASNVVPDSIQPQVPMFGPTAQQIAARHVVPKDLPEFTGDPTEWPLFASSYYNSTAMCGYSDGENLMRLQRCLKGKPREAVRCHLLHPSSVPQIMATLHTLYGRPELIVRCLLNKVHSTPAPKADKLESLVNFGLVVQNLCSHLQSMGMEAHLSNPTLLEELVDKLPANIKLDWGLYQRQLFVVDMRAFGDYMSTIISAASKVTLWTEAGRSDKQKGKEKGFLNAHSTEEATKHEQREEQKWNSSGTPKVIERPKPCLVCKKEGHKVKDCRSFLSANIENRWKLVQQTNVCRRCLIPHGKWPCKATLCGMNGCELRHHKLLHPGRPEASSNPRIPPSTTTTGTINLHRLQPRPTLFRVLPVTIHGKDSSVTTLAFLDDGSSFTLVEQELAKELGVTGEAEPLCLQWTSGIKRIEAKSQSIQLQIAGVNDNRQHALNDVRTVEKLDLPPQFLRYPELAEKYEYLKGLPVASYDRAVPRILIGVDNASLLVTLKKREGKTYEPVATKTRLGWTIFGTVEGFKGTLEQRHLHICARSTDQELHDTVKEFFSVESICVAVVPEVEGEDDRRAREILSETTIRTSTGRFQTGLLWKHDYVEFPDSRDMAEQRLKCLERRLAKNPKLYSNINQQVVDYQHKGYAHKLSREESVNSDPRRVWYLPLGVVLNPNKPEKIRVIWDAAAKVEGVSFNSMLLKGPDLLTSLTVVLYRFRQRQIAIAGDIKEMFHQIQIRREDRQAQRFLWRDEPGKPAQEYVMDVATFGSTCSPCSAHYVKNKNAEEWKHQFPKAAAAIIENHYVDDYLDSLDTDEEAVELALEVKKVHAKAGFEIRNWLSNSELVTRRVGDSSQQITKNFMADKGTSTEKVLGMVWKPKEDTFTFAVKFREDVQLLINGTSAPTKRQVLRVVMSIFDPLGIVAAFVIHGKCLIQDIWRTGIGWDEAIPGELHDTWRRWVEVLHSLSRIGIPRCYFPGYSSSSLPSLELHVFVDASEAAYACVAYFRMVDHGQVRCSLVAAKTKVAPLKPMSVPRLELQAAVIGARLMKSIQQSHTLPIYRRVIWSDSRTVLSWVRSDQRKYRQFVAFRVSEILDETSLDEWRWVPTRLNVADEATKWGKGPNFQKDSRWFCGPEYLYADESEWPNQDLPTSDTVEELRPVYVANQHHRAPVETTVDYRRFSKLERLLRAIGYVRRFSAITKKKYDAEITCSPVLSRQEILEAELTVWRWVQAESYPDELTILWGNEQLQPHERRKLEKCSQLRKLSPFIDANGVLRIDGRLSNASHTTYDAKFPVILPKDHRFTELLVEWYHRRYAHGNGQTVLNEMRQKFHISCLRTLIRRVAKQCRWCAVYRSTPRVPRMAPLPEVRVTPYVRAFTFIGVDYCGPFPIRSGRSEVKTWVMLITCLTVRAVHLESVGSLSTEACKLAIRRFIAWRGAPQEIYSDQGTNFIGASRELREEIANINRSMAGTFTNSETQWHFNPPAAPHMGGVWERLVRSVKTALRTISTIKKPNDETFRTFLAEAASIVNSRPLTYVPLETEDGEALTPNHFMMLSSSGVVQPTKPIGTGKALRTNWDTIQNLLDQFWLKWIKEYLPSINCRSKWLTDSKPVQPGDLVLLVNKESRNGWVRGRVVKVYKGKDGRVRSVDVQTVNGVLQRPVTGLAVLEVLNDGTAGRDVQQYGSGIVGETD